VRIIAACKDRGDEAGAWISGQTIHVDGGWILRP
jgi:NAD(P)-dependent dehydrogenase (short-subunit alcohol dehydrogenase family)